MSKNEYKYRYKLIYEYHYNKAMQQKLDSEIHILKKSGVLTPYKIIYSLMKMSTVDALNYLSDLTSSTTLSYESVISVFQTVASLPIRGV